MTWERPRSALCRSKLRTPDSEENEVDPISTGRARTTGFLGFTVQPKGQGQGATDQTQRGKGNWIDKLSAKCHAAQQGVGGKGDQGQCGENQYHHGSSGKNLWESVFVG